MSNQVQLSNQAFVFNSNQIRVYGTYENPLFCLADVCKVLQLTSPNKTANQIKEEFEGEELNSYPLQTKGGVQKLTFITEPQLYFVMMRSRAKTAKSFRQWICNEVIPKIRKTGKYEQKPKPTMRQGYSVKDLWNTPDSYFLDKIEEYHKKNIIKNSLALDIKYCFDMRVRDNIINTIRLVENTPVLPETKLSTSEFLSMNEQEKLVIMRENGLKCELYSFNENLKWYKFKKCPFPYIDLQSVAMLFGFDIKLLKMSFFKNIDSFVLGKDLIIIDDTNKIDDESYLLSFTGIERIFNYYFA